MQKSTKLKKGICNNFRRGVIKQYIYIIRWQIILIQEIQNIICAGILDDEGEVPVRNITLSPLFDYKFYEAANILLRKNKDGKLWSNNLLFDYNSLLYILNNSLQSNDEFPIK